MGNTTSEIDKIDLIDQIDLIDEELESIDQNSISQESTIKKLEDILKCELERRDRSHFKISIDKTDLHKSLLEAEKHNSKLDVEKHSKEVSNLSDIVALKDAEISSLKAEILDLTTSLDKWRRFYYEANESSKLKRLERVDLNRVDLNRVDQTHRMSQDSEYVFCEKPLYYVNGQSVDRRSRSTDRPIEYRSTTWYDNNRHLFN